MTQVTLFKDETTEDILIELEKASEKYTGLHVDMENKDERKFVKDKALLISGMRKKVERARIDKNSDHKVLVDAEAKSIDCRLADANAPFDILINGYKIERAKILAEEKAIRDAKELLIQIASDYDDAIMEDKVKTFEKAEAIRLQLEREEQIKASAIAHATETAEREAIEAEERRLKDIELAVIAEQNKVKHEKEAKELAEAKRLSNQAHVTSIKTAVKESLMQFAGLSEQDAINVVKAIATNKITHTTINF